MNRAFTVWLDLSAQSQSGAVSTALNQHPLPAFTLPITRPMTKREIGTKLMQWLWAGRAHIAAALLLWKLLAKLRELSISTHQSPTRALCGPLDANLFPQYVVSPSTGVWLYCRAWRVPPQQERGYVFILHAYREHIGRYEPLVAALNAGGFSVYGHDHQGHGQSGGERGYVASFQHYVLDSLHFMRHIQREIIESGGAVRPVFLLGHGMGSLMALQMARIEEWRMAAEAEDRDRVAALMQALQQPPSTVSLRSPPPVHAGTAVSAAIEEDAEEEEEESKDAGDDGGSSFGVRSLNSSDSPLLASAAPSSSSSSSSSRDSSRSSSSSGWRLNGLLLSAPALLLPSVSPLLQALASLLADVLPKARPAGAVLDWTMLSGLRVVGEQWRSDPLTLQCAMPARYGSEMLAAMGDVREGLGEITLPALLLQGRRDRYVSPAGAQFALEHLGSADKSIRWYDAEHDAWLDESRAHFANDCVTWLQQHTNQPPALNDDDEKQ